MNKKNLLRLLASVALSLGIAGAAAGCAGAPAADEASGSTDAAAEATGAAVPADGTYAIEVETDSSMFHADSCELTVTDGVCTATLVLPGEGFSRLYFGSAEDAATAADDDIYDYYLNDEGKYAFDIPVEALDEELPIAAFGHRRDTWYDHTITFASPAAADAADAA